MAKEILIDCKIVINSVDVSNYVNSVEIDGDAEVKDSTGFGDGTRTYAVGYKNWSLKLNFMHDYADNGMNEQLYAWWGTSQAIEITKADATVSATNPKFSGTGIFQSVPLFNASVGEISGGSITVQGSGVLTRSVS